MGYTLRKARNDWSKSPGGQMRNLRTRACSRVSRSAGVERSDRFHSDEARWLAGMKVPDVSCRAKGQTWGRAGESLYH
jgi:hypothetical protein